jgi:hypothetical protein
MAIQDVSVYASETCDRLDYRWKGLTEGKQGAREKEDQRKRGERLCQV